MRVVQGLAKVVPTRDGVQPLEASGFLVERAAVRLSPGPGCKVTQIGCIWVCGWGRLYQLSSHHTASPPSTCWKLQEGAYFNSVYVL